MDVSLVVVRVTLNKDAPLVHLPHEPNHHKRPFSGKSATIRCSDSALSATPGNLNDSQIALSAPKTGRQLLFIGIPVAGAVGRLKTVPLESNLIRTARALGISLGK